MLLYVSQRDGNGSEPELPISGMKIQGVVGYLFPRRSCFFFTRDQNQTGNVRKGFPIPRRWKARMKANSHKRTFRLRMKKYFFYFIWTRPKCGNNIRTVSYPFMSRFYDRKQCLRVHCVVHLAQNYLIIIMLIPITRTNSPFPPPLQNTLIRKGFSFLSSIYQKSRVRISVLYEGLCRRQKSAGRNLRCQ